MGNCCRNNAWRAILKGGINLAAGIAGMDPNDPLSGPDWRIPIPGGKDPDGRDNDIAITPYAKYLKREGREYDAKGWLLLEKS